MEQRMLRVGITHGDINGISYELILKTFQDTRLTELCIPVLYGSSKIAAYHRKALELPPVNLSCINRADESGGGRVNIINCIHEETKVELAKPSKEAGEAALCSLDLATADLKRRTIDVLVTTPVNKRVIALGDYPVIAPFLEKHFENGKAKSLNILVFGEIRIAMLTGHIPLSEVCSYVTGDLIMDKLTVFNRSLIQDFNIVKPRIAVLALNPKAGVAMPDSEEEKVLIPAIEKLGERGIMVFGPYPVDAFFGGMMYDKFDGVFAMYHDQVMTPFKTLFGNEGVNYTAGLSIVHTSPAHGSAYNIAGRSIASESSFRSAIYTALDIYRNRVRFAESSVNPLRKQYFDKGTGDDSVDLTAEDDETL